MYSCEIKGECMNKLIVISGPSGCGKGSVVKELQNIYEKENKKLYLSISCTTRLPRDGEQEGISYYFISEQDFIDKIKDNDFLEYNKYGTGKYYGTPKSTVLKYLNDGYDIILEIDINGYKQVKNNYPNAIGIFIMPPSMGELENRLRNRHTETEESIQKRLKTAEEEIKTNDIYPYIIINENNKQEETASKIYQIINK